MAQTIDTLALFDELKSSFTEDQAHVLSKSLRQVAEARLEELATKQDLLGLKGELATKQELLGLKNELATKQDLLVLKQDLFGLKRELTNLETRMEAMETRIDAKLAALESKMIKWMVGLAIAQFSILIAGLGSVLALLFSGFR